MNIRTISLFLSVVSGLVASAEPPSEIRSAYTETVMEDFFSGRRLNEQRWKILKNEYAHDKSYEVRAHEDAFQLKDGKVRLRVFERSQRNGNRRYRVGIIDSRPRESRPGFEARYGYIEARIRFNVRSGSTGAFWLQSRDNEPQSSNELARTVLNPDLFVKKHGAEVDIIEAVTTHNPDNENKRLKSDPRTGFIDYRRRWLINIHWNGYRDKREKNPPEALHQAARGNIPLARWQKDIIGEWHVYGLLWEEDKYTFYLDGRPMWSTTQGVSGQKEYIILGMGILGTNFNGKPPERGFGDPGSHRNPIMLVDWIRWWQTKEQQANDQNTE